MITLDIASWWANKILFEQIFWICAIPATIVLIILLITTFIGGDIDAEIDNIDAEVDADAGAGFQFFTFKNLVGFFTIFGWVGVGCAQGNVSPIATLIISSICGLLMMTAMASVFYFMSRLVEDGSMVITNAIGRMGQVYMRIPANGEGIGKVQINVQGSVRELDAIAAENEELATGTVVKVVEIIDGHILKVIKHKN
jgi:hypothetical protein